MNRILLVARREYRQVTATRGFWMLMLVVPLAIGVSILGAAYINPPRTAAYVVVDPVGRIAAAIDGRVGDDHERETMAALSAFAARWSADRAAPALPAGTSDAEAEAFRVQGGVKAALAALAGRLKPGAPAFVPPPPRFVRIAPPPGVPVSAGPDAFGTALAGRMQGEVATPAGPRSLALGLWVPADFGPDHPAVRIWSNRPGNRELAEIVRGALGRDLRLSALRNLGVGAPAVERIDALAPAVNLAEPTAGHGRDRVILSSLLPLALVYLLLVASMTTGSMMLQGVIEERSNKLIESVLACLRPDELMQGKLLGLGGVGLTIVAVWVSCAVAAALATQGAVADLLRPSLQSLDQPWMAPALIFYFVSGYLIISAVFLAIGSMSDSMQDAQAYLMPVLMVIMMPVVLMIDSVVINPDSPAARIMTWIPFYTPFAMLARLGGGVPLGEAIGSGVVLVAFIWLEMIVLGRIFRASVLSTGQRPPLSALVRLIAHARQP
jgi:ABC-2 type transport system permease protein